MALLSCAGLYVSGDEGSNECPAGSVRIETEGACRTAAVAAGKNLPMFTPFVETFSDYPRGCYYSTLTNYAYFNPEGFGAGQSSSRLLCAGVCTVMRMP